MLYPVDNEDIEYEDRVSSDTTDYDDGDLTKPENSRPFDDGVDFDEDFDDEDDEGNWVDCLDSPTNSDEYIVNEDDSADAGDVYDIEYDR